jgi:hypothetical protein
MSSDAPLSSDARASAAGIAAAQLAEPLIGTGALRDHCFVFVFFANMKKGFEKKQRAALVQTTVD